MELLCKGCISQPSNFLQRVSRVPAYNYVLWAKYLQTHISEEANPQQLHFITVSFKNSLDLDQKNNKLNPGQRSCTQLSTAAAAWPMLRQDRCLCSKERERAHGLGACGCSLSPGLSSLLVLLGVRVQLWPLSGLKPRNSNSFVSSSKASQCCLMAAAEHSCSCWRFVLLCLKFRL